MFQITTMPSRPTPTATRFRMPVGASARTAMTCGEAEVYIKGTTVFADLVASAAARPNALGTPGVRSWSPPV
jgi:hypothetical protein